MGKYQRLLVGVDGSEASLHALQEAFKLASNWVTVVAVAPFYEGDLRLLGVLGAGRIAREPCDLALARAQELADAAGAVITPVCAVGEPHERLVALAEAGSRDLIVLGARGQSFIERILLGSVTQRVIGYSSKDVLVVPLDGTIGWDRLLVATDGSTSSRAGAARALELAQTHGSELLVISVQDFPAGLRGVAPQDRLQFLKICEDNVSEVINQAEARHLKSQGFVPEGVASHAIVDLAREHRVNLIVMGSHGRTALPRLLLGRVAERVIGHAPCPVLVMKGE